ncbi:mediator of RNA polymerase II transcription subunit 1-domain-containing protein [Lasiosphaeria miniovina]|uniref:Mediator of RNA polymerase II transcription subunit 1 n=1 Tax=Lasiosphaeria miniovina TaxID=1954250 RepID=A0AA40B3R3_9PEZI|nr:mediator of RNA polymerase II transcription subunit 1-domain-containing protein [Lasiosphaeria miniovina]KAK0726962.1 mediator of RNA polymerase II transcription subunit 1-domain-containing protein [Lasiosphaeria miniovina]
MATPTPTAMKHALSQQGKTPSQSQQQQQHGAAATPPVSTPFSAAHAVFSPHGPRSSPQQVKKSPATLGHPSNPAINFDSPSAAAAFGALQVNTSMDLNLQGLGGLGSMARSTGDEFLKKLDSVIAILGRSKGLVSEAGLERLATRLGLECLWENGMGPEPKKTLIVAGSALELLVVFSKDIVQSVSLSFPESADVVNKHADEAGRILMKDLMLAPNQSPLNKQLDSFAANFGRLAALDRLSINPGLNLYEAVAGIHESLSRLNKWETQKVREDSALVGKSEEYLQNLVLCTKSGLPAMNARDQVGLTIAYWKERRLVPSTNPSLSFWRDKNEKIWALLIGCAPLGELGGRPVRVSDKWIGPDVEKISLHDGLRTGPILDWLEPESTLIPAPDPAKPGVGADVLLGPRLPEVVFHATFDPPIHVSLSLWSQIGQSGCGLPTSNEQLKSFDSLLFPIPPGAHHDPSEPRTITCTKKIPFTPRGPVPQWSLNTHANTLYVYKPIYGKTLTELSFSQPEHLVNMLPYLRQYAFLATLLENSFKETTSPPAPPASHPSMVSTGTSTSQNQFSVFMEGEGAVEEVPSDDGPVKVDVTLTVHRFPRLQVMFPFRSWTANILLEIQENGHVHVEAQNVLDESNAFAPNGKQRRIEDIGACLETIEDIGKWCNHIRTRWAVGYGKQ